MNTDGYTDRQQGGLISLLLFFQNKERKLIMEIQKDASCIRVCMASDISDVSIQVRCSNPILHTG
jgi:hypothetical protein